MKPQPKLVIAISSSALFDLNEADAVFQNEGLEAYQKYQISKEHTPLSEGVAFNFVNKLLKINKILNV